PGSTLSAAEAISVVTNGQALAVHFGDGVIKAADVAAGLTGAIIKDPTQDAIVWKEYLEVVVKERSEWKDLYRACKDLL
ncbi:MAG TPA: ATPase, partial [Saprospiraceae bacterium]|nr:ATPase [Saprospiraceae bacterium]